MTGSYWRKSGKISSALAFVLSKMAGMITVSFEGKRVGLSREDLTISEIERIYQIDSPGAHLKVKSGAGFENIWPDRAGKFTVPPNCFSAIVVAMHRQENEQENTCMPNYSGGTGSMGNRRGNSAATFFSPAFFNERFEPSNFGVQFSRHVTRSKQILPSERNGIKTCPSSLGR